MAGNPRVTIGCWPAGGLTAISGAADKRRMARAETTGGPAGPPWLVGDIGATNLRFALAYPDGAGWRLESGQRMLVRDHSDIDAALDRYLAGIAPRRPACAALAVAGPVLGDRIEITNTGWHWSNDALQQRFGLKRLACLNDAEAQALALPHLGAADVRRIGHEKLLAIPGAPRLLIAPGSGLGVASLIEADGRPHALAGEGGHMTMAPGNAVERDIAASLATRHPDHVSWERILSGPGISAIHSVIETRNGIAASGTQPHDVLRAAQAGDSFAKSAIALFIGLLGSFAGDLALAFGARGGVYIGGGIAPSMVDLIESGPFRQRFEAKGRFRDYLRAIPTGVVMHPEPGLVGAAAHLAAKMEQGGAE